MKFTRLTVLLVAAAVAAVLVAPASAAKKPPRIKAFFGPGLDFDVKRGKKVLSTGANGSMRLRAGKYRWVLTDDSVAHNFQIENAAGKIIKGKKGKKKRRVKTSVSGTTRKPQVFVVNLKKGRYTLVCQPHRTVGMTVLITVN